MDFFQFYKGFNYGAYYLINQRTSIVSLLDHLKYVLLTFSSFSYLVMEIEIAVLRKTKGKIKLSQLIWDHNLQILKKSLLQNILRRAEAIKIPWFQDQKRHFQKFRKVQRALIFQHPGRPIDPTGTIKRKRRNDWIVTNCG